MSAPFPNYRGPSNFTGKRSKTSGSCRRFLASLTMAAAAPLLLIATSAMSPVVAQNAFTTQNTAGPAKAQSSGQQSGSLTGATVNFAPNPKAGKWPSQARDYANTRCSPLDQINTKNVDQLRIAWTFSDGTFFGHEGAPLVSEGQEGRVLIGNSMR